MSAAPSSDDITTDNSPERMSLQSLPYDLLLNVAQHLELRDVYAVQLTCRTLHEFASTRPVFRNLAAELLRRCRGLPLSGFQRLSDLSTTQLAQAVRKATRLEQAWLTRAPRPATFFPDATAQNSTGDSPQWYKVISAPPNEEVDWLSPITSSYSLCATKSGKVVCWDVHRDISLAEWTPKGRWELWKCRVEFEVRTVFFTMAKVLHRSFEDRLMEFVLMKLEFPETMLDGCEDPSTSPTFDEISTFKTIGVVMNVFLLDPPSRLLCAFVWVSNSNTIGLYALLDWDKQEYVFIDTGIECSMSSNWSCILYKEQIVIHSEESDMAYQFFYPISLLSQHIKAASASPNFVPILSARVSPVTTMSAPFVFPQHPGSPTNSSASTHPDTPAHDEPPAAPAHTNGAAPDTNGAALVPNGAAPAPNGATPDGEALANPFPFPPWYPESAHFVRQWWPTLPSVPRLSCTVVLLADHDPESHRTQYVLAQHYFRVPLLDPALLEAEAAGALRKATRREDDAADGTARAGTSDTATHDGGTRARTSAMRIWYVSQPFEVVCVLDGVEEEGDDGTTQTERPRPLMAVDFGHAVWVEYLEPEGEEHRGEGGEDETGDAKRLRFVSFPPVSSLWDEEARCNEDVSRDETAVYSGTEGKVQTLEIPPDLDLDTVETINIDQSQGAVIVSVKEGKIFILYYE